MIHEFVDFENWKKVCDEEGAVGRYIEYEDSYKLIAKTEDNLLSVICIIKKEGNEGNVFRANYKSILKGLSHVKKQNELI